MTTLYILVGYNTASGDMIATPYATRKEAEATMADRVANNRRRWVFTVVAATPDRPGAC